MDKICFEYLYEIFIWKFVMSIWNIRFATFIVLYLRLFCLINSQGISFEVGNNSFLLIPHPTSTFIRQFCHGKIRNVYNAYKLEMHTMHIKLFLAVILIWIEISLHIDISIFLWCQRHNHLKLVSADRKLYSPIRFFLYSYAYKR